MMCEKCRAKVTEADTSFSGLHSTNDCFGRVYFDTGREFLGGMKRVSVKRRASDLCSLDMEAL